MSDAARVSLGFLVGSVVSALGFLATVWLAWLGFDRWVGGADEDLLVFFGLVGCGVILFVPALLVGGVVGARIIAGRAAWRA
jgi:hypothetical protein